MSSRKTNEKQTRSNTHSNTKKDHEPKTMVATTMAGIVGTITVFISGYLISHGVHRVTSIWVGFVGVVLLVLSGTLYLLSEEPPKSASKDPLPPNPPALQPSVTPTQPINVSSNNQSGGITAGIVNVGDTHRAIKKDSIPIFLPILRAAPKTKTRISFLSGDSEAESFAQMIAAMLQMAEVEVQLQPCLAFGRNPKGISVFDWVKTPESMASAKAIKETLAAIGYESTIKDSSEAISDGPINIHVGPRQ